MVTKFKLARLILILEHVHPLQQVEASPGPSEVLGLDTAIVVLMLLYYCLYVKSSRFWMVEWLFHYEGDNGSIWRVCRGFLFFSPSGEQGVLRCSCPPLTACHVSHLPPRQGVCKLRFCLYILKQLWLLLAIWMLALSHFTSTVGYKMVCRLLPSWPNSTAGLLHMLGCVAWWLACLLTP